MKAKHPLILLCISLILASAASAANYNFQVNEYEAGFQIDPDLVVRNDGSFIIAWNSGCNNWFCDPNAPTQDGGSYGSFVRIFDSNDQPLTPEIQVNSFTFGYQDTSKVAADAQGNFIVVWVSRGTGQDGSGDGVYAQRFDSNGNKVCRDGSALVNCPDDGNPANGVEPEFRINDITAGAQRASHVAMASDSSFVVGSELTIDGGLAINTL